MAVNLTLADRRPAEPEDPMGRAWYGWDRFSTDDELWDVNRGVWNLAAGAANERFATLSHRGVIRVVAEITNRVPYTVNGGNRWALDGEVLRPGDPVRDALVGTVVPRSRNPVSYLDTAQLDELATAERSTIMAHDPVTMLVTWNPAKWIWDPEERTRDIEAIESGGVVRGQWATGGRRSGVEPGDRVFMLMQGDGLRGIIGSGTCASRIFQDGHWDPDRVGELANYALIDWDTLLPPEQALPRTDLIAQLPAGGDWRPQASGTLLEPEVAADLEQLWAEHLGLSGPVPPRTSPRQRWQMDPDRRKKVENAAQDRLTEHYRQRGWTVKDTRYGNPYDAVATKNGRTLYLEAKGTETAGSAVIVTRAEVEWARNHRGECVLGILSDIRFQPDGEVDPDSGTFQVFHWNPDTGDLAPRAFDWTPPDQDKIHG